MSLKRGLVLILLIQNNYFTSEEIINEAPNETRN